LCRIGLGLGLSIAPMAVPLPVSATPDKRDPPPAETLFDRLAFDADERQRVEAGEIVTRVLPSTGEQQLRVASALTLPRPLTEVRRRLAEVAFYPPDPDLLAAGTLEMTGDAASSPWAGCDFSASEAAELARLRQVAPGSTFNLSPAEIAVLRRVPIEADGATISDVFCQVLRRRALSYAEHGIAGIAPYDRGGGEIRRPDMALNAEAQAFAALFNPYLGALRRAVAASPRAVVGIAQNRLSWRKTLIDGRVGFQLLHVLADHGESWSAVLTRQFYVSHSYDGLQAIAILYDRGTGTLLIDENATTTDQIPPLFASLARSLGAAALRRTLSRHFAALRHNLQMP
jgi:hypothetical protein